MSELSQLSERTSHRSHHSRDPGWYRSGHRCRPCAPVLRDLPILLGPSGIIPVQYVSFWYALMYGLLVWVYIWLTMALWRVEPEPGCSW